MDFVILGVMTLLAGVVCLRLPETRGKAMPETIENLETRPSEQSRKTQLKSMTKISEEKLKLLENEIENNQDAV